MLFVAATGRKQKLKSKQRTKTKQQYGCSIETRTIDTCLMVVEPVQDSSTFHSFGKSLCCTVKSYDGGGSDETTTGIITTTT